MKDGAGFAAGLVVSLVLHAALVAGVCAAWGLSAVAVEPDCAETPLALDLAQVDLSFSDEARDEAPARPAPAAAPAPPAEPPPPPRLAEPPPLVAPPAPEAAAAAKADDVRATALRPQEPEAPDAPETPPPPVPAAAPPQTAAAPAPVQARVDAPPAPRRTIKPQYPIGARARGEQGDVTLELAVDAQGAVVGVKVVASCGFSDLERAAVAAARRATFRPAKRGHRAVPAVARLTLTFRLRDGQ